MKIENTKKNLSQIEGMIKGLGKVKAEKMIKDAKEMLGDIADLSLVKTLKESAGSFDILRENHSKYEKRWFVAFCISSVLLLDQLFYYF